MKGQSLCLFQVFDTKTIIV